jgi:hypothetical protein
VCLAISASRVRAFTVTMAVALGTLVLPFSYLFFGHQLAAALLFGSFYLIFQRKTRPERSSDGRLF